MNRTNNLSLSRTKPHLPPGNPNLLLIALATLFITGLVIGAICVHTAGHTILEKLTQMFQNYSQIRTQQSMLLNFSNSFATGAGCILVLYLCGLSAWGSIPSLLIPVFKGMGLGIICGTLYADYGVHGFGYCALVIMPGALLSTIAILLPAKEAIRWSAAIFNKICLSRESHSERFRNYSIKFLILLLFVAVSSVVDMLAIRLFSGILVV